MLSCAIVFGHDSSTGHWHSLLATHLLWSCWPKLFLAVLQGHWSPVTFRYSLTERQDVSESFPSILPG